MRGTRVEEGIPHATLDGAATSIPRVEAGDQPFGYDGRDRAVAGSGYRSDLGGLKNEGE